MRKPQQIEEILVDGILIKAKICSVCKTVKPLNDYYKDSRRVTGYGLRCKECEKTVSKKSRIKNAETIKIRNARFYASHKERQLEMQRKRRRENPQLMASYRHTRRAKLYGACADLSKEQLKQAFEYFGDKCALTGAESPTIDHFIPLSKGGRHTYSNIIPLSVSLNSSKHNNNPFEWFDENKENLSLSEQKFKDVVSYLAKLNKMTFDEYKELVYKQCSD